jgi:uncharacterized membrane protein YeiH
MMKAPLVALGQLPLVEAPAGLLTLFDYSASFLWALSGALLAARRGYTGMSVFVVAMLSATGGGLLRDGLLLSRVPDVLEDPVYVVLAFTASALVMAFGKRVDGLKLMTPAVHFVDAMGAGGCAVVGVSKAIEAGLPFGGIVIVGVTNAIGGGLFRDVVMRRVPDLVKPGLPFGTASLLAACLFALLVTQTNLDETNAGFITIAIVFLLNLLVIRLNIRSRPLEDFREYWEDAK